MLRNLIFFPALVAYSVQALAQVTLNPSPTRVIGQTSLTVNGYTPNLVEGRELNNPLGVALDLTANPPHLYVADTGNNRVLGWSNAAGFSNGQKADIVIGQPDLITTIGQGPGRNGSTRSTGLTAPVGLAVDAAGSLYIADCGNNRILRIPHPFASGASEFPDLVLGQANFSTNTANANGIGPTTLLLNPYNSPYAAYLALDAAGNLWVADPGNNRVLRFPRASLGSATSGASADLVIGQADFVSGGLPSYSPQSLTEIFTPTGVMFDSSGNLYVSESVNGRAGRVLVYSAPSQNGQAATRLVGASTATQATPINASQLGSAPGGIFPVAGNLAIADTSNSRILLYSPISQWTGDPDTQIAASVIGQPGFTTGTPNLGQAEAAANSVQFPADAAFSGTELYVADAGNNRVIVLPQSGTSFGAATRVLGQDAMNFNAPNLIEGREVDFTSALTGSSDAGIAIDLGSTPPHLYIADTYNNRVLCYNDLHSVRPGSKADLVIGQPDFQHKLINYPSNNAAQPNQSGLYGPVGLAIDKSGNLYVADSGNARVMRFPTPFSANQSLPNADIVLGQSSFTIRITDASASTMSQPYGLAFASDNGLLVSDLLDNRVLFFAGNAANFKSGISAAKVFGQPDFTTITTGSDNSSLSSPRHIATDASDRLYVADTGNNRISIFDNAPAAASNPQAAITIPSLAAPRGVFVNRNSGEIWVANTNSGQALRFPSFDQLVLSNYQPSATFNEATPLALLQDNSGALYVADAANRVVIHFAGIAGLNAANYIPDRPLTPGMIVSLFSLSNQTGYFGSSTQTFTTLPLPTTLADTQVMVNDQPAPLFYVSPNQINFVMPNGAPGSGTVTIEVQSASTGQVMGSSIVQMATSSPGLFTLPANGSGQVAAINQDGSINGSSNPAPWNSVVEFFGTGPGMIPNAPSDGQAASGPTPTTGTLRVVIGATYADSNILYSGLAPGLVGVWQVNIKIPNSVPPTTASAPTPVFFLLDGVPTGGPTLGRTVTMWVKSN